MTAALALIAALIAGTGGVANAEDAAATGPLAEAIGLTKPLLDMRLRYELVDQAPIARTANAGTLRIRGGFETGRAWDTSLLAEMEVVAPIITAYNSTINGKTRFPTVADPRAIAINRLQLTNISLPSTAITVGRQRINLDDQRFVGNVGWRQNEQTFDAARLVNKSIDGLTVDGTYLRRVNRVFGNYSPQGRYKGDSALINVAYQTPWGKLTAFSYLLEFDPSPVAARADSTQTFGGRFAGSKDIDAVKLTYAASYATQKDFANNLLRFSNDYYLVELSGAYKQFSAGGGYEVLGGNGAKGFTTPLATLHKFQGWVDKFLTTPPNGIRDLYFNAGYTEKGVGPFDSVGLSAIYHRFNSDRLSLHYGNEINAQILAKWQKFTFIIKYGDYSAKKFATDTTKLWLQVEYAL